MPHRSPMHLAGRCRISVLQPRSGQADPWTVGDRRRATGPVCPQRGSGSWLTKNLAHPEAFWEPLGNRWGWIDRHKRPLRGESTRREDGLPRRFSGVVNPSWAFQQNPGSPPVSRPRACGAPLADDDRISRYMTANKGQRDAHSCTLVSSSYQDDKAAGPRSLFDFLRVQDFFGF